MQIVPWHKETYYPTVHMIERAYSSTLASQIADLALPVFIAWDRLFAAPTPVVSKALGSSFSVRHSFSAPMQGYYESGNLERFHRILDVLEGGRFGKSAEEDRRTLLTLSHHIRALSVLKGTLASTHWVCEEDDHSTLNVWNMLGYYAHLKEKYKMQYDHIFPLIEKRIVDALKKDVSVFRAIYIYEKRKEQIEHLERQRFNFLIRMFYDFQMRAAHPDIEDFHIRTMSVLGNLPEIQELDKLWLRKALSHEKGVEKAEKIWKTLADSQPSIACKVLQTEALWGIDKEIDAVKTSLHSTKQFTDGAALNEVKKILQGFYEFEQLQVALECTRALVESDHTSQDALKQWVVVLRESTKLVLHDSVLNIQTSKSIKNLPKNIKLLRDYFEHPEDYVLEKSAPKKEELLSDLKKLGQSSMAMIELRLKKIERLLCNRKEISPEDVLKVFSFRDDTQNSREGGQEAFPYFAQYCDAIQLKKGSGPKDETELIRACRAINREAKRYSREELSQLIQTDRVFRLNIQGKISQASRALELYVRLLKNRSDTPRNYSLLENIYFDVRDARNLQTHDLWLQDTQRIINTIYLLGLELPEVIANLDAEWQAIPHLFEELVNKMLTGDGLTHEELNAAFDRGFKSEWCDRKNRTLLHFLINVASEEHLKCAKIFLDRGGNVNAADVALKRPLHYAADNGSLDFAKLLVERKAVVDAKNCFGSTPAETAEDFNNRDFVSFLSQHRGISRSLNAKKLLEAVRTCDVERVLILLKSGEIDVTIEFDEWLPFIACFENDHVNEGVEIAQHLLDFGADPRQCQSDGNNALHVAIEYSENEKVIDFLLGLGLDVNCVNNHGDAPLHIAVQRGRTMWVKRLLEEGADTSRFNRLTMTPILIANDPAIFEDLLEHGADADAEDEFGRVLHNAADFGGPKKLSLLLKYNPRLFVKGRKGNYVGKWPFEVASCAQSRSLLLAKTHQVFINHLTKEDQGRAVEMDTTGLFQRWLDETNL